MLTTSLRAGYTAAKAALCVLILLMAAKGVRPQRMDAPERPITLASLIADSHKEPIKTGSLPKAKVR